MNLSDLLATLEELRLALSVKIATTEIEANKARPLRWMDAVEEAAKRLTKREKRVAFVEPTLAEVTSAMREAGLLNGTASEQAAAFVEYYGAQGWRLANGVRMAAWKLACGRWVRSYREKNTQGRLTAAEKAKRMGVG